MNKNFYVEILRTYDGCTKKEAEKIVKNASKEFLNSLEEFYYRQRKLSFYED